MVMLLLRLPRYAFVSGSLTNPPCRDRRRLFLVARVCGALHNDPAFGRSLWHVISIAGRNAVFQLERLRTRVSFCHFFSAALHRILWVNPNSSARKPSAECSCPPEVLRAQGTACFVAERFPSPCACFWTRSASPLERARAGW